MRPSRKISENTFCNCEGIYVLSSPKATKKSGREVCKVIITLSGGKLNVSAQVQSIQGMAHHHGMVNSRHRKVTHSGPLWSVIQPVRGEAVCG